MGKESVKERSEAICPCDTSCPLGKALSMIGGKWKIRIICTLYVDGTGWDCHKKPICGDPAESGVFPDRAGQRALADPSQACSLGEGRGVRR